MHLLMVDTAVTMSTVSSRICHEWNDVYVCALAFSVHRYTKGPVSVKDERLKAVSKEHC